MIMTRSMNGLTSLRLSLKSSRKARKSPKGNSSNAVRSVFRENMLGHLLVVVLGFALIVGLGLRIIGQL